MVDRGALLIVGGTAVEILRLVSPCGWRSPLRFRYSSGRKSIWRAWASETCDMPCLAVQPLRNRSSGVSCGAGLSFSSRCMCVHVAGRHTGQSWHVLSLSYFPLSVEKEGRGELLLLDQASLRMLNMAVHAASVKVCGHQYP